MPSPRIVEPIDILEYRPFRLASCFPAIAPDQLCLERFEGRLDHGIVVAVSFSAHRDLDAMFGQALLILIGAILGGFNLSSQHPVLGGVDDKNRQTKIRTFDTGQIKFSRNATSLAT